MKAKTLEKVSFPSGTRLGLTEAQAASRGHALKLVGEGQYLALEPVQFKAGEVLSVLSPLDKSMRALLAAQRDPKAK